MSSLPCCQLCRMVEKREGLQPVVWPHSRQAARPQLLQRTLDYASQQTPAGTQCHTAGKALKAL